jgi:hypothetical protein
MSYVDRFGGNTVQSSNNSYISIALNANQTLSWPTEFQNINGIVNYYMDVAPNAVGRTLTMPDARLAGPGSACVINNTTATAFDVLMNGGGLLVTINGQTSSEIFLINNTTPAGTWRNLPRAAGGVAVTSVNAAVPNAIDSNNLTVAGVPITAAGTINLGFAADLRALISFDANVGILARTGVNAWALRTIATPAGGNLVVTNGNGVAGDISIDLQANLGIPGQNAINRIQVGNINIQGNVISSIDVNGNISINPNGTGQIDTTASVYIRVGQAIRFYNTDNSHYASLSAVGVPAGGAGFDLPLIFPSIAPLTNQFLQYIGPLAPGVSNLRWANVANYAGGPSTDEAIARYDGATGSLQNSAVIIHDDGSMVCPTTITANGSLNSGSIFLQNANQTLGTSAGPLNLSPAAAANQIISNSDFYIGTTAAPRNIRFASASGFAVSLTAPAGMAGNVSLTLPPTQGGNTALLQSDGAGVLTFTNIAGTGTSGQTASSATVRLAVSTSQPVVPNTMVAHNGVIKAAGNFAGATGALGFTYNAAIARTGAGVYQVTFLTNNMINTTYMIEVSCTYTAGAGNANLVYYLNKLTTGFTILAFLLDGVTPADPTDISFCCLGNQFV